MYLAELARRHYDRATGAGEYDLLSAEEQIATQKLVSELLTDVFALSFDELELLRKRLDQYKRKELGRAAFVSYKGFHQLSWSELTATQQEAWIKAAESLL